MKYVIEFESMMDLGKVRICIMRNNWETRFGAKLSRPFSSYIYVNDINAAYIMRQELSDDPKNSSYTYEVKEIS